MAVQTFRLAVVPTVVKDNTPDFYVHLGQYSNLKSFRLSNIKPGLRLFHHIFKHCAIFSDKVDTNRMTDTHIHILYTRRRLVYVCLP